MKIMIIGCGRQGAELAKTLGLNDCEVVVIDNDPASFERLQPSFDGRMLLGSGIDHDILVEGGIERVDGMAAVTASDDINIVAARLARQVFRVPQVVARVHDPLKAEIYQRLGLMTVTPAVLGTMRFIELLTFSPMEPVRRLGSGDVSIIELEVPPLLIGRTVNELNVPGEIQVVAITRGNTTYMPMLGAVLQERDTVHICIHLYAMERLKSMLGVM